MDERGKPVTLKIFERNLYIIQIYYLPSLYEEQNSK